MQDKVKTTAMMGLLTALVVVLQLIPIRVGFFTLSTVLVPIVVGAALYGAAGGCWLGFIFGATVILSGQAAAFMAINPAGTIVTVLIKGIAAGGVVGLVYRILVKKDVKLATVTASALAPITNTGVFIIGCLIFFPYDLKYIITVFVGINFIIELLFNLVLSSTIMFLIKTARNKM